MKIDLSFEDSVERFQMTPFHLNIPEELVGKKVTLKKYHDEIKASFENLKEGNTAASINNSLHIPPKLFNYFE